MAPRRQLSRLEPAQQQIRVTNHGLPFQKFARVPLHHYHITYKEPSMTIFHYCCEALLRPMVDSNLHR